ncbi:MAG: substrate-binding domain-containing protein [Muribaculum sp.]|nr:substrate-binding domain-containing protein [Muribaculum sp.]
MKRILYIVAAMACLSILLPACNSKGGKRQGPKGNTSTSGTVVMACDASFENIMEQEIEVFEYVYPHASVLTYYTDEKACVDSLLFGTARLAVLTRELTREQENFLKEKRHFAKTKKIAVDAVAVIVNPDNPVENISVADLREILSGKVTQWSDIYPSKLGKIQVIFDHNGSSVVKYMQDSLLGKDAQFAQNVYAAGSMREVFNAVQERKNAIGVVGVSWISSDMKSSELTAEERVKTLEADDTTSTTFTDDVKVLAVRSDSSMVAYKPYQAYIFDGSYPLYRSVYMINTGASGSLANGFFAFVTSFRGQKLMMSTGVLPATVHHRTVSVD